MKKYLYIFLAVIIFIAGIWILNNFGVISVRAWGENVITNTPFVRDYVETNQAYNEVEEELEQLRNDYQELQEERNQLSRQYNQAEDRVNQQEELIEDLQESLAALETERYSEEERFEQLVKIYGEMKPREAAPIIQALDDELAIEILMNLRPDQSAEILAALPAEDAASYSRELR